MAPGIFADANHPSGSPDPGKLPLVWDVDPITGALSVRIPFPTTPSGGRGPKVPFALMYNSSSTLTLQTIGAAAQGGGMYASVNCQDNPNNASDCEIAVTDEGAPPNAEILETLGWTGTPIGPVYAPVGPWTTTGPFFSIFNSQIVNQVYEVNPYGGSGQVFVNLGDGCTTYGPYLYTDENGVSHDLNLNRISGPTANMMPVCQQAYNNSQTANPTVGGPGQGTQSQSTDGAALLSFNTPSVITKDGTQVFGSGIEDSNGNFASFVTSAGGKTFEDSLGRAAFTTNIPIGRSGQLPTGTFSVNTTGATGSQEHYSVSIANTAFGSVTMPHPQGGSADEVTNQGYCVGSITCPTDHGVQQVTPGSTIPVVKQISLPDGTSYAFTYDAKYATVSRITFPTGGYVRFVWGIRSNSGGFGAYTAYSSLVVTDAYISDGDGTEKHWHYSFPDYSTSSGLTSTITAPDGSYTKYTGAGGFIYSSLFQMGAAPGWKVGKSQTYTSAGTLVRSVDMTYDGSPSSPNNGLPLSSATTQYDGVSPLQQQVKYTYDSYGNVIGKYESDFYTCSGTPCSVPSSPPGGWLRETLTRYNYQNNSQWLAYNLVDRPAKVVVADGAGNPYSVTTYAYDESGHLGTSPTGVTYHDDTNYGAGSTTPRGNVTTESRCITITGTGLNATCSSAWNTFYYYDLTGQVTQKIVGGGTSAAASTTYTWTGQESGFLTGVQYPNGATDAYTFFTPTGQVHTHVDWNSRTTTYAYSDSLNRLTSVTDPSTTDGTTGSAGNGKTTYIYTDAAGGFSLEEQHLISGGTTTSTTKSFDGLGRLTTVTTQVPASQCSGSVLTSTTSYDSMGRIASVSNPYCSTGDPTYGSTTFQYDVLGRKTQTTYPGGAQSNTSYGGNAVKNTDPPNGTVSVQHIQQSDGIGRLTDVCEVTSTALGADLAPSDCHLNVAGTGYLTHYGYDVLGNLISVNQHGQSRSFQYDGLSRLMRATNPETGTGPVVYTYSTPSAPCAADPGLPCTKTDARGVIATFSYDGMQRLVGKSYSTAATGTISDLSSCFQYDVPLSNVSDSNPKGQLTAEWQQAGACPASQVTAIPAGAVAVRIRSQHDSMGRTVRDQQCLNSSSCSSVGNFYYSFNLLGGVTQASNGIRAAAVSATQVGTNSTTMHAPSVTWMTAYDLAGYADQVYVQDQPASTVWPAGAVGAAFSLNPTLMSVSNFDAFGHVTGAQEGTAYGSSSSAITVARQYDTRARITSEVDQGSVTTTSATGSTGSISISGSEKSSTKTGTNATATLEISGSEQSYSFDPCIPHGSCPQTIYDGGGYTVVVNGISVGGFGWGQGATPNTLAASLASSINGNSNSPVTASASGSSVLLTSKITGTAGDYGISVTTSWSANSYFSSPSFTLGAPASLTNGTNGGTAYDSGSVTVTINGKTASASWNSSTNTTSQNLASALRSAISSADCAFLTASLTNSTTIGLVSTGTGTSTNWPIQITVAYDSADFSSASYSFSPSPNPGMTGGTNSNQGVGTIYSYAVPSGGYAANGNILQHADSVMGTWNFHYDAADRLVSATAGGGVPSQFVGKIGCWGYDTYGNRTLEAVSGVNCSSNPTPQVLNTYDTTKNQIVNSTFSPNTLSGVGTFLYDASGNTRYDGKNRYWYDAEGRLCAVSTAAGAKIRYIYDAEGVRIAQGTFSSLPASYTATCPNPVASGSGLSDSLGFSLTKRYLVDQGGEQVTEMDGSGTWKHSNIWSGGRLLATYDSKGLHFELTDPLGTKRIQANAAGQVDEACTGLPFGNDLNNPLPVSCSAPANPLQTNTDATENHFTGKERDSESGNDYFGARYYASAMGRFLSPDPLNPVRSSQKVLAQFLDDPQNWNKYSYGLNNPVRYTDTTGNFTGKDHMAMEMAALRAQGYSDRAARIAAGADARMDNFHNMASGVPFLHHFVETSENPQHGEREDHSDVATAKSQAENFMADKELTAAFKALSGATDQALEALGQASHTAQDIVRHQFEEAKDHPLGEAPATDEETKAAVAATQQVEKDFETALAAVGHDQGMSNAQIQATLDRVKKGQNGNN